MLELSKSDVRPPELLQLQINTSLLSQFLCSMLYSTNHKLPHILFTFLIKYPRHNFVHTLYYTLTVHTQPGQNHVFKNTISKSNVYKMCNKGCVIRFSVHYKPNHLSIDQERGCQCWESEKRCCPSWAISLTRVELYRRNIITNMERSFYIVEG